MDNFERLIRKIDMYMFLKPTEGTEWKTDSIDAQSLKAGVQNKRITKLDSTGVNFLINIIYLKIIPY